jgi:hypothetical protein
VIARPNFITSDNELSLRSARRANTQATLQLESTSELPPKTRRGTEHAATITVPGSLAALVCILVACVSIWVDDPAPLTSVLGLAAPPWKSR